MSSAECKESIPRLDLLLLLSEKKRNTTSFGIARDVLILPVVVHETGKTEADFEPINRIDRE